MKLLIIVLMFFIFGALFIINNNNLAIYEKTNFEKFSKLYVKWLNSVYVNVQVLTAEIVKLDWIP